MAINYLHHYCFPKINVYLQCFKFHCKIHDFFCITSHWIINNIMIAFLIFSPFFFCYRLWYLLWMLNLLYSLTGYFISQTKTTLWILVRKIFFCGQWSKTNPDSFLNNGILVNSEHVCCHSTTEPAILLMHHSIRSHPTITCTLLDFLCRVWISFLFLWSSCFKELYYWEQKECWNLRKQSNSNLSSVILWQSYTYVRRCKFCN